MHRFGNYEIVSLMGRGGMAEVFRARVLEGERAGWPVAIKRLLPELAEDPAYVELFEREAALSKALDHPYIVKVLEVERIDHHAVMVMELIDGRDLGQVLRRCKQRGIPWPIDFAGHAVRILLDALAYAHAAKGPTGKPLNLVHCDISPSNLFVSRTGDIKLGDFGVARGRTQAISDASLLGKPFYFSPETLAGEVTPATDLWAAAVTLYELLTLERPFQGHTPDAVFEAIHKRDFRPLREARPEVSPELEAIVVKCFALDPGDRFQTAAAFSKALAAQYDERVGTSLAISAVVRGLFGATSPTAAP